MPTIPSPVLILAAIVTTQAGQFQNVSYWELATPPTTATAMQAIVDAASTQMATPYKGYLNTSCSFIGVKGVFKNGATELEASSTMGAVTGDGGNILLPDEVAVVVRKITSTGGRSNTGRYFLTGVDSGIIDGSNSNEIDPTAAAPVTAVATFYGADKTFASTLAHARHWNRKTNTLVAITSCKISSRLASRRDRRRHDADFPI